MRGVAVSPDAHTVGVTVKLNRIVSARSCGLASAVACLPALCAGPAVAQQSGESVPLPPVTVEATQQQKKPQKKAVAKKAAPATVQPSPAPQPPSSAPAPTTYQGATGPANGYVATESATATKTGTPLIETPQSVSVVTREQIEQQGAESVSDALHYTAGVIVDVRPSSRYDIVNIRGLGNLQSFVHYQDGLKLQRGISYNVPVVDPYLLERIEVMKGPSSVLYGQVGVGGIVNFVSKKPLDEPFGEVALQFGSHDRRQLAFDFGAPIDEAGKLSYRLTGIGRETGTDISGVDEERYAIAPTITWRPNAGTTLTLLGSYLNDPKSTYSVAVPAVGSVLPNGSAGKIPHFFNIGDPAYDMFEREQYSAGYLFEHELDSIWTVRQNFRFMSIDTEFAALSPTRYNPAGSSVIARNKSHAIDEADTYAVDTQAEANFRTGAIAHTALFGFDYQYVDASRLLGTQQNAAGGPILVPDINYNNPVYGQSIARPPFQTRTGLETDQIGIYAQEQLKFGNWVAVLGGRYDWAGYDYDQETVAGVSQVNVSQKDEEFTWRGGLLYNFDNGFAPYFSYATSFEPITGTANTAVDYAGNPFKPTTGEQYEVGIKYQPRGFNALITASLFDIALQNVLTPDPDHTSSPGTVYPCNPLSGGVPSTTTICQKQTGEVRTRGFEIEARASLSDNLDVAAAYAYLDTEITETNTAAELGKRPTAVPEHMASFWAFYTFDEGILNGFGFGGGVRYVGETFGNTINTWTVDSYTIVDAAATYDFGAIAREFEGYKVQVNALNLFDKEYYASCGAFGGGFPATGATNSACHYGVGRNVMVTLKYQW